MAKKLLCLSDALHQYDNPTECPVDCGENVHCDAYMDIIERRMIEHGVEVMRPLPEGVGEQTMYARVAEANKRKAILYYVAHTNASGKKDAKVHRSVTLCWDDEASKAKAAVIGKYRKSLPHTVSPRTDLYEIRKTTMPCLYDELFFHDNAEDCAWFHNGGMEIMAEETVQALCELLEVEYVPVDREGDLQAENEALRFQLGELQKEIAQLRDEETLLKKQVADLKHKIAAAQKALA